MTLRRAEIAASAAPVVITVSNRLPVSIGPDAQLERTSGGLATAVGSLHQSSRGRWVGWAGALDDLAADDLSQITSALEAGRFTPVAVPAEEYRTFYDVISNGVLWPICHDRLDQLPLHVEGWEAYDRVNRRFAEVTGSLHRPGELIWVHDYHLLRTPAHLREIAPDARIGFFLHVPFPNPEVFFALGPRRWLIEGMLGADVIGFQTRRWRGHFTAALRRLFGIEMEADGTIEWQGRSITLGIHPIGADAERFQRLARGPEVRAAQRSIQSDGQRVLLGVDRGDYTKGILRRLTAYARFLRIKPEWLGKVRLVQVAVPSRSGLEAYEALRGEISALVDRINGEFSTPSWSPVRYLHRAIPDDLLVALYRAADVMLVTPLRDGMNLVCKEFIASRTDEDGVLVLSEFAGAADELGEALVVNPYDVSLVADTIHRALTMPAGLRRERMRALRRTVIANDAAAWSRAFLEALVGEGQVALAGG